MQLTLAGTATSPSMVNCSENQVPCANNQSCVWSSFLCDNDFDCSDQSDELDCGESEWSSEKERGRGQGKITWLL